MLSIDAISSIVHFYMGLKASEVVRNFLVAALAR